MPWREIDVIAYSVCLVLDTNLIYLAYHITLPLPDKSIFCYSIHVREYLTGLPVQLNFLGKPLHVYCKIGQVNMPST